MDRKDLIKVAVEDHLRDAFSNSSFTPEVRQKVDRIIKSRIEYYKEYFKDNPLARKFAEKFTPQEISILGTHEANYNPLTSQISPKEHYYIIHQYLREREYIIKYFYEPGLTYEQMRTKYLEDKFNNPRKYNLTDTHKKRILKDWAKHFPEMVPFKSKITYHLLFKMVGPFIFEIGIRKSNLHKDKYTPGLWVTHLLLPINETGSTGILESESHHFKDIKVIDHYQGFYTDIVEIVREKFWFPLEGDISLDQICKFQALTDDVRAKALALSWAGRQDLAIEPRDEYLNILRDLKDKDPNYYKENATKYMELFNFEYDPDNVGAAWEQKFIEIIDNPDFIRDIVRDNVKKFGVELGLNIVPYQDIKDAPYKELSLR